jgi:hypothetical protein
LTTSLLLAVAAVDMELVVAVEPVGFVPEPGYL